MTGQQIAYIRVSSAGQNLDRQEALAATCDKVFREKASAKTRQRPELDALMDYAREGDTVHVHSIDRLARDLMDLEAIVRELHEKGVGLVFEKEGMSFSPDRDADPMQRLLFQMLGAFSQFERTLIEERRREGVAAAKAAGRLTHPPSPAQRHPGGPGEGAGGPRRPQSHRRA